MIVNQHHKCCELEIFSSESEHSPENERVATLKANDNIQVRGREAGSLRVHLGRKQHEWPGHPTYMCTLWGRLLWEVSRKMGHWPVTEERLSGSSSPTPSDDPLPKHDKKYWDGTTFWNLSGVEAIRRSMSVRESYLRVRCSALRGCFWELIDQPQSSIDASGLESGCFMENPRSDRIIGQNQRRLSKVSKH